MMSEQISWDDMINNRFHLVSGDRNDIRITVEDIGDDSIACYT